jgi:hypothetical protein
MKRLAPVCVLGLVLWGAGAAPSARAQYNPSYGASPAPTYSPYGRSASVLSPYLDIRRGGNPALNFFLGTLPEIDRRNTKAIQGAEILGLERQLNAPPAAEEPLLEGTAGLPPTGHPTAFGNYGGYFNQQAGPVAGPRTTSAPQARRR